MSHLGLTEEPSCPVFALTLMLPLPESLVMEKAQSVRPFILLEMVLVVDGS